ncbi:ABC transporter substrate-binding protein [Dongshaea marina]|uniref:ABC transporter substrate-binding protein n=1 Tax=Dongshaea marina TaxID=2047966 RepID=UPI00131EED2B|nr:ABC transporter substrate binding protein [Dongshaea marina]
MIRPLALILCLLFSHISLSKTIFIIESYHSDYPWDISYMEGIRQELGADYRLERFHMNTKRLPESQYQQQADRAWARYQELQPDLVILADDNALKYLFRRLSSVQTPVVFLGINGNPNPIVLTAPNRNFTGILERPLFKHSAVALKALLKPRPKKLLILFDGGLTSKVAVSRIFAKKSKVEVSGISLELRLIRDFASWKKIVEHSKSDGYDAIIIGLYQTLVNSQGQHVPAQQVIHWTSKHTPLPLFSYWRFSVGPQKTAGGLVLSGKDQGRQAGIVTRQILEQGVQPKDVPPYPAERGQYIFSRSQMKQWNIRVPDKLQSQIEWVD